MKTILLPLLLLFLPLLPLSAKFPGMAKKWHGYDLHEFKHGGVNCKVVTPTNVACGKPWIWRARFWGTNPSWTRLCWIWGGMWCSVMSVTSLVMTRRLDAGMPSMTTWWGAQIFRETVLEGMSRGGLIIYNWAAVNPEAVACIYAGCPGVGHPELAWRQREREGQRRGLEDVHERPWPDRGIGKRL